MYKNKRIILSICARGGSKGVIKKNIRTLCGKPLIAHTIEQAQQVSCVDRIIVSTDDREIKKIAEACGINVPFLRPRYLSSDSAPKFPAIQHAVRSAMHFWKESYDISIDLDVTAPFRYRVDIENCIKMLVNLPKTKAVVSVYPAQRSPYFNLVEPNEKGYIALSKTPRNPIIRRQDAPTVYAMNASIYAMWVKDLLRESSYHTDQTRAYIMPKERSLDIDDSLDWEIAEYIFAKRIK